MSSSQSMEEGAGGMRFLLKLFDSSATRASGVKVSGGREDSMTEASFTRICALLIEDRSLTQQ